MNAPRQTESHDPREQMPIGDRERFLRMVADNVQDILYRYRVRPEPGFEYVSPSCTRITGYTPEEHYADPLLHLRLVHPGDLHLIEAMAAADLPDDTVLLRWVRRDGAVVWTEQRTVAVRDESGQTVAVEGVVRDVTTRARAQARLQAMVEVTHASLEQRPTDDVLGLVAHYACELAAGSLAVVVVPDRKKRLRVRAAEGLGAAALPRGSLDARGTLAEEVLRTRRPVRAADAVAEHPDWTPQPGVRVGPLLALPLGANDGAAGVLSITREPGSPPFSDEDVEVMSSFAEQASMVLEGARLRDELQKLAVVRDRERIARDLHDGVIQSLFGVGLALQVAESEEADDRLIRTRLSSAMADIDRIIYDVRSYVYRLRPSLLQRSSLADALARLAADMESRYAVVGAVEADPDALDLLAPVAPDVVQVVRESLNNVARHARALTARVAVHREGDVVRVTVEDDGRGFDPAATPPGQGLDNLSARARELDGWLLVHSSPGAGTTVEMLLPLTALEAQAAAAAGGPVTA